MESSGRKGPIMRRTAVAVAGGVAAATLAAFAIGAVVYGNGDVGALGFWAYVFGAVAGLVTFAGLAALLQEGRRPEALYGLALVLGLFTLGAMWWSVMWGFPGLSDPEGLWLWPLMILSGAGAGMAFVSARRTTAR